MRCVIFGFGYMGKIRYQVLRHRPDVNEILIVDPGIDVTQAKIEGKLLTWRCLHSLGDHRCGVHMHAEQRDSEFVRRRAPSMRKRFLREASGKKLG